MQKNINTTSVWELNYQWGEGKKGLEVIKMSIIHWSAAAMSSPKPWRVSAGAHRADRPLMMERTGRLTRGLPLIATLIYILAFYFSPAQHTSASQSKEELSLEKLPPIALSTLPPVTYSMKIKVSWYQTPMSRDCFEPELRAALEKKKHPAHTIVWWDICLDVDCAGRDIRCVWKYT